MKRKVLLLLWLMALGVPLAMNGQQTNTLLTEGFESSTLNTTYQASAWYSYNAGSGNNWEFSTLSYHNGSKCAAYSYNSSYAANCYMVSMPFSVSANMSRLSVSLYERVAGSSYPEKFEVFFVKASDITTQAGVASVTQYSAIATASYSNESYNEVTGYSESASLRGQSVRVVLSTAPLRRICLDSTSMTSLSPRQHKLGPPAIARRPSAATLTVLPILNWVALEIRPQPLQQTVTATTRANQQI